MLILAILMGAFFLALGSLLWVVCDAEELERIKQDREHAESDV